MLFFKMFTGAIMAAMSCPALAAVTRRDFTPEVLVEALEMMAQIVEDIQRPAKEITLLNTAPILVGEGPLQEVIDGYDDIASKGEAFLGTAEGTPHITDEEDAENVATAYRHVSALSKSCNYQWLLLTEYHLVCRSQRGYATNSHW